MPLTDLPISDAGRKAVVLAWLNGDDSKQDEALSALDALPETEKPPVSAALLPLLGGQAPSPSRMRLVRALGRLSQPDGIEALVQRLGPAVEPSEPIRCLVALTLADSDPNRLLAWLRADNPVLDPLPRARAARRLAPAIPEALGLLRSYIESDSWPLRLVACHAIREPGPAPDLSTPDRKQLVPALSALLVGSDASGVAAEAALALALLKQPEALAPLSEALRLQSDYNVRRCCLQALTAIDPASAQPALIEALKDPRNTEGEISTLALNALENHLRKSGVVSLLVEQVLGQSQAPPGWLDALCRLDRAAACQHLQLKMLDPNRATRNRAALALAELGNDRIFWSYQAIRLEAMEKDSQKVNEATDRILNSYNALLSKAGSSWDFGLVFHTLAFVVSVLLLIYGLSVAAANADAFRRFFGIGNAVAGMLSLLALVFFHPLRTLRVSLDRTIRSGLLLMSELRRLGQAEALSKHILLTTNLSPEQIMNMAQEMRAGYRDSLDQADSYLRNS